MVFDRIVEATKATPRLSRPIVTSHIMASLEYTSQADFKSTYDTLHSTFATGRTKSIKWRKWQLKQLWWMIVENEDRIVEALRQEMNRPAFETIGMETRSIKGDVVEFLARVDEWAEGEKPDAGFFMGTLAKAWMRKEPLGVALVIAAWNFPLYTLLSPAIAAIGAGKFVDEIQNST